MKRLKILIPALAVLALAGQAAAQGTGSEEARREAERQRAEAELEKALEELFPQAELAKQKACPVEQQLDYLGQRVPVEVELVQSNTHRCDEH